MDKKGSIFDGKFKISKKLGEGSFGSVFKAKNLDTKEYVALKVDNIVTSSVPLMNEVHALEALSSVKGIPKLISYGKVNNVGYFAIELLGKTLNERFNRLNNRLSLGCVLNISRQLLRILQEVHENNYIHRDIKPSNLMTGYKKNKKSLFLIDFGLAKRFRDPATKQHEIYRENRHIIGNLKYASLSSNLGIEQSRRDDLESWLYLQVNFLTGRLPWDEAHVSKLNHDISRIKSEITPDRLCDGCPPEFIEMVKYIKSLKFDTKPDYNFLDSLITDISLKSSFDLEFDWVSKKNRKINDFLCIQVSKKKNVRRSSQNFDTKGFLSMSMQSNSPTCSSIDNELTSICGSVRGSQLDLKPVEEDNLESCYRIEVHDTDEDRKREIERADTIKNVYPEFRNKHVHFG